jgi:PST family polysaccharide transporter
MYWMAIYNALEKYKIVFLQIISKGFCFLQLFLIVNHAVNGGLLAVALGELIMVLVTFGCYKR